MLKFIIKPTLFISNDAYLKMQEYIAQSDKEIGWLGTCSRQDEDYIINNVYLFDQEVHETTCEITEEGLNKFALELMEKPNGMDIWNNICLWGHSHVNMGVLPSSQDNKQLDFFLKNMKEGFFIRYIGNKRNEIGLKIIDIDKNIILDETEINIKRIMTEEDVNQIMALEEEIKELNEKIFNIKKCPEIFVNNIKTEIAEKVKEKKYTFATGNTVYKTYQKDKEWQNNIYKDYSDEYEYYNPYYEKEDASEEYSFQVAKEVFDSLSEEGIFELAIAIDINQDIEELLEKEDRKKLNETEFGVFELEDMIIAYIKDNKDVRDRYSKYLMEVQNYGI